MGHKPLNTRQCSQYVAMDAFITVMLTNFDLEQIIKFAAHQMRFIYDRAPG